MPEARLRITAYRQLAEATRVRELKELRRNWKDRFGRLPLGPDEQDAAALGDRIGYRDQRLMKQRHGLGQINDVDIVSFTKNIGGHFRVPVTGLMPEMDAGLQHLAHGNIRHVSEFS